MTFRTCFFIPFSSFNNEEKIKVQTLQYKRITTRDNSNFPVDTGRKLNVHKTFRRRPGRLLNVLCMFNLRPVSTGFQSHDQEESKLNSNINANSGAHTLKHDKIIKSPFNKNHVATIKSK